MEHKGELLRAESEIFFSILQKIPYGVMLVSEGGQNVYVNPEFTHITGYTLEEVPTGRDLVRKAFPESHNDGKVLETWWDDPLQQAAEWTLSFFCKDGTVKEVEFRPALLDGGRRLLTIRDVTAKVRTQELLRRTREDLEQRVRERTAELLKSKELLELEIEERARVEQALRQSWIRYRSLVKQSSDGIYVLDPRSSRILEANDQFLKMLGYTEEEITRLSLEDIVVFENESVKESIAKILKDRHDVFGLRQYRCKDGSLIDAEISATLMSVGDARVIMVNVRNVTDRRRAEAALQASERRYRTLFEESRDAVYLNRLDGTFVDGNQSMLDLFGYTKEEMKALNSRALYVNPSQRDEFKAMLWEKGFVRDYEVKFRGNDGSVMNCLVTSTFWRADDGTVLGYQGIIHDITERKRAEEALRAARDELEVRVQERTGELRSANEKLVQELGRRKQIEEMLRKAAERYKNLFDNSPLGIYRTNPEGRILMANPTLARMLGYGSFGELATATRNKGDYLPTYLRKQFRDRLKREGRVRGLVSTWKRSDGSAIFVRENAKAILGEDGNVLFYEGTVEDITEQKKAEEMIQNYQEQLRYLASQLSLTEERERRRLATALHDTVGQILAVSRIKLGGLVESAPTPSLGTALKEVRGLVEQAIEYTRSLTFELSLPILYELGLEPALEWLGEQIQEQHAIQSFFETDGEPKPVDDETRVFLFTAVRELLVNVAKHAKADRVRISARRDGGEIVVQVWDNGAGLDGSKMSLGPGESGGFGLFSIRERIRHLGGRVDIKSRREEGTTITLTAPLNLQKGRRQGRHNGSESSHSR
ncbi:MAG TPA: PAS domain S-box protein [Syntrophorhabdales bacterium]|nr:PAS domain S-box protein [Syntrophorhabdales bacterium]